MLTYRRSEAMMHSMQSLICVLVLILSLPASVAESISCAKRRVVVSVLDRKGEVVHGLAPAMFQARVHGQTLRISGADESTVPRRVVIAVDLSGSARQNAELSRLLAGNMAVSAEAEKLRVALVLFSDHIIDSVKFSQSSGDVVNKLIKVPDPQGRTALFDALDYSSNMFNEPLPGDSIYLISDGEENASAIHQTQLEKEIAERGIRIFSFQLVSNPYFPTEEGRVSGSLLSHLAELTGGMSLKIDVDSSGKGKERLREALQKLYRQIADVYELEIEMPLDPSQQTERWDLSVLDQQGRRRKDVQVLFPHEATCPK